MPSDSRVPNTGLEWNAYAESLGLARITNPADQYKIDRVTLENLLARIIDRFQHKDLSEQQKNELFKLLPSLVERAIASSHAEQFQLGNTGAATTDPLLDLGKKEEIARLERLKNQYFQNAREYVKIGNYQYALVEVRRMYIVDPENPVARQYEKWIEQLAKLQNQQSLPEQIPVAAEEIVETEEVPAVEADEALASDAAVLSELHRKDAPEPRLNSYAQSVSDSRFTFLSLVVVLLFVIGGGLYVYYLNVSKRTISAGTYLRSVLPPPERQRLNDLETTDVPSPATSTPAVKRSEKDPYSVARESSAPSNQTFTSQRRTRRFAESETFSPSPIEGDDNSPAVELEQTPANTVETAPPASPAVLANTTEPASSTTRTSEPFVAVEKPPQIIRLAKPRYPEVALRAGIEGEVIVKARIDPQGRPEVAVILKSSSMLFDDAAIEAVMNSQFAPGHMSTGPVTTWIVVPLRFKPN